MMISRQPARLLWLLWLLSGVAVARDPFAPAETASCLQPAPALTQWRLQGIIGRADDYRGWLLSPQGQVVTVASTGDFLLYPWEVSEINGVAIHLQVAQRCEQQRFTLRLKGRDYEMDNHRDTGAAESTGPQQ
ncbi:pilus assembly protein HofP [Erwinia toletana]|uniref:Pilus assembly protein HofP n=1 Tax=Winslowiella toletana TaxID=92490 RepID=A0ABS4P7M9_9GAMM|nr:HofP DNA utilization family protein [Winslowiella toletana]MBP2168642.1 pilus assembly protein HofP [Winslowiella toletana]